MRMADGEELYTLAEAEEVLNQNRCQDHGHDLNVVYLGADPIRISCGRCGRRYVVEDESVGHMKINQYQSAAGETAVYEDAGRQTFDAMNYVLVAMGGEAGEVLNAYKKDLRGDENPDAWEKIDEEVGDLLWYIARYATERGLPLERLAELNLIKLSNRSREGTIQDH